MARIVVMGAGVSGHTTATFLAKWLGREHEVVVVTPNAKWNWIPSNIWVGIGKMSTDDVTFLLAPVYKKIGATYVQAKAIAIHPEGDSDSSTPYIDVEHTSQEKFAETEKITYDFLVNATGPKLNFAATEGMGPDGFTESVYTANHASEASTKLDLIIEELKKGNEKTVVIGAGHGVCSNQGSAFDYIFNVAHKLETEGVREKAKLVWLTNEYELGDFGMGGVRLEKGGNITNTKVFMESLLSEKEIIWITRAHVKSVTEKTIHIEKLDGEDYEIDYDFAMLSPLLTGVGLKSYNKVGKEVTDELFDSNGFLKVDANYTSKDYKEWSAKDWPSTYQNPKYKNIFAVGSAFAPPHLVSKPMESPNGTAINPTLPRDGMPSATIGKLTAKNIKFMIENGTLEPEHKLSMAEIGASCSVSAGNGIFSGTAASITVYPLVPDFEKYPQYGRDLGSTFEEIGLAGYWIKNIAHCMFLYKAQCKPGWTLIPE